MMEDQSTTTNNSSSTTTPTTNNSNTTTNNNSNNRNNHTTTTTITLANIDKQSAPVYLSKQQRALLVKQEKQRLIEQKRLEMEKMRQERQKIMDQNNNQNNNSVGGHSSRLNDRESGVSLRPEELSDLQMDYLGTRRLKTRHVKSSEKHKFSFDWRAEDDTSRDLNPIYDKKHEAMVMFGRGKRAGMDESESAKQRLAYEELVEQRLKRDHRQMESQIQALADRRASNKRMRLDGAPFDDKTGGSSSSNRSSSNRSSNRLALSSKHWSEKTLAQMDNRDWRIFREDFEIGTKGGRVPNPLRNWDESDLPFELVDRMKELNFSKPTPIQMQCIPIGLQNRDLIGLAETGSGKTLAYLLPMLVYISKLPKMTREVAANGPYALVLAPTRELAQQIESVAKELGKCMGIRAFSVVGGVAIDHQLFSMRDGCEIIIGTPGRLIECIENRFIVLNQCNYVVLDEADRMIDMDFEEDLNTILEAMPSSNIRPESEAEEVEKHYRQTTMFSATMPLELEQIASKYLRRKVIVTIGEVGKAVQLINQQVQFVKSENDKMLRLVELLEDSTPPIIVFVNTKKGVDDVAKCLDKRMGFRVTTLHGSKTQEQRQMALDGFKNGKYEVLVATDVLSRGIDIPGVTLVVNFDLPKKISIYTHRIGRTGRAGKAGVAVSFLTNDDEDIMADLKKMLLDTNNIVPDELMNHPAAIKGGPGGKRNDAIVK